MVGRRLTELEIKKLEAQGNVSADWTKVTVSGDMVVTDKICDNYFEGRVHLEENVNVQRSTLSGYAIMSGARVISSTLECDTNVISVLNESGGREVFCSIDITPQIAYLQAFHSYKEGLSAAFERMSKEEALCVIAPNARVVTNSILKNCYVGHDTYIEDFSAENCVIADNCQLTHGEAVAVFCGPFTVSHHKSTLLIAALYSFYNAGSATNASNHHYRLGPRHQAVYCRGVKSGSGSYVLEPAHIGDFSMVVGHHRGHPDTSKLPFSYLVEKNEQTYVFPAQNLKSVGMWRDIAKWPSRSKGKSAIQADFDINHPYFISRLFAEAELLKTLYETASGDIIIYEGCRIQKIMIPRAERLCRDMAEALLLSRYCASSKKNVSSTVNSDERWIDVCGTFFPSGMISNFEEEIIQGKYSSISEVANAMVTLYEDSQACAEEWVVSMIKSHFRLKSISDDVLRPIVEKCRRFLVGHIESLLSDASRESGSRMNVSYGIDGTNDDMMKDYNRIHDNLTKDAEKSVEVLRDYIACMSL
ncbi:MAG: DUF4954 family protein [Marinilabiliaceae bacterium]|nr:DUF4954 family protein [Marinilabiliaceae bacterium]